MDKLSKIKLYIITIFLDVYLFYILSSYNLSQFDELWIFSVFICHILFYYSLSVQNKALIDFLHYFVFILPTLSVFAKSTFLKIISCILLLLIQILWIKEKRCIMNEINQDFGYGDIISYYTLLLTTLLSFIIGYEIKIII